MLSGVAEYYEGSVRDGVRRGDLRVLGTGGYPRVEFGVAGDAERQVVQVDPRLVENVLAARSS